MLSPNKLIWYCVSVSPSSVAELVKLSYKLLIKPSYVVIPFLYSFFRELPLYSCNESLVTFSCVEKNEIEQEIPGLFF